MQDRIGPNKLACIVVKLVLANKGFVFKINKISQGEHRKSAIMHTYAITHFMLSLQLKWKDEVLAFPKLQVFLVQGRKQSNTVVCVCSCISYAVWYFWRKSTSKINVNNIERK